jgi:hypothetical protein
MDHNAGLLSDKMKSNNTIKINGGPSGRKKEWGHRSGTRRPPLRLGYYGSYVANKTLRLY